MILSTTMLAHVAAAGLPLAALAADVSRSFASVVSHQRSSWSRD